MIPCPVQTLIVASVATTSIRRRLPGVATMDRQVTPFRVSFSRRRVSTISANLMASQDMTLAAIAQEHGMSDAFRERLTPP
jgi:hypothetical protein